MAIVQWCRAQPDFTQWPGPVPNRAIDPREWTDNSCSGAERYTARDPPFTTRPGVVSYRDAPVNASNMKRHGKEKTDGSDPIIVSIYLLAPLVPSNETLISC